MRKISDFQFHISDWAISAVACCCLAAGPWKIAEPGWQYEFPQDHHAHFEFKTEWWYFTGNLADEKGRRFGYELTFFRQGIRPPAQRNERLSRFVVNDLKFAHFTVTDVTGKRFSFQQKASRGSFGEAGFDDGNRIAWIESWNLLIKDDGSFEISADSAEASIHLQLRPRKSPTIHGTNGICQKAKGNEHTSHYYSITRLSTTGQLRTGGDSFSVSGESWFDHEWATNQLAPEQAGWNWLGVQFDGNSELMLYEMRLNDGTIDPISSGTFVGADGSNIYLPSSAFHMTPDRFWKSKTTGANYPIGWRIEIPELQLHFAVRAVLDNQELALNPLTYWEGAIEVSGMQNEKPVSGRGYLELTGYAASLQELQR